MTQSDPRFHVPAPHARPGDTPDFSHIEIPPAGEARKPAVDIDGSEACVCVCVCVRVYVMFVFVCVCVYVCT